MKPRDSFSSAEGLDNEGRLLIAHIDDMARAAKKSFSPRFSGFLTAAEAASAKRFLEYMGEKNYLLWGGFEGAERVVLGIFPEDFREDSERRESFPLQIVKFSGKMAGTLSHRDCLGAIMSLGIERSMTGDILCKEDCVYAALLPAAARMAVNEIRKIGRAGVKCTYAVGDERIQRQDSFKEINGTAASLRLDCIISEAARVSRTKAAELIRSGAVSVNHRVTESVSENVGEGDILSVRGCGRFILDNADSERTKKGRLKILIKKYL